MPLGRRAKATARNLLGSRGVEIRRPPPVLLREPGSYLTVDLEHLVALQLQREPSIFFVQIGAFDGRTGDQLHEHIVRHRWRGILVEPQPAQFAELQRTYAEQPGLTLRNVAISSRRETRTLYALDPSAPGLPDWAPQVATFDRTRLEKAGVCGSDGEIAIVDYEVECIPMADLLDGVQRVDLLQVDAEGFDAEIIGMFDFDTYRPSIVRFENICLTRADHDRAVRRLISYGYRVAPVGTDTIAWNDGHA